MAVDRALERPDVRARWACPPGTMFSDHARRRERPSADRMGFEKDAERATECYPSLICEYDSDQTS